MKSLFPNLEGRWGYLNLNELARNDRQHEPNPLIDPYYCHRWVERQHILNCINYSYGGYMELRDVIWKGSYLPSMPFHLGVDYNVPERTVVTMPVDGELIEAEQFENESFGWGGRLIFKYFGRAAIMAHLVLSENVKQLKERSRIKKGTVIGYVGNPEENGGWFPHLHVQVGTIAEVENGVELGTLDGYSEYYHGMILSWLNPHSIFPMPNAAVN